MKHSLRSQLIFQYMVIVIVCMLVIPTAISELLEWQFKNFLNDRLDEYETEFTDYFASLYEETGTWRARGIFPRGSDFIRWPIAMIQIKDAEGNLVRSYSRFMVKSGPMHGRGHHQRGPVVLPEGLQVRSRDIIARGERVGQVFFTVLPFDKSPESNFLNNFNKIMYYAVAVMLIIAAMIAIFMAYRISTPVLNAARRAQQISMGKYTVEGQNASDITELQTLIESVDRLGRGLEEQEELRKRLMSDIAHELRNPVAVIKSHLEAMEDGVWEPTPERIRLTVSEVDRLSQLIREVEKLTSIEGAAHSLSVEETDASSPLYKNKGVELKRDIEPGVMMQLDGAKMRQVVENLLSNALRYTDAGGSVTVALTGGEKEMTVSVADTGIGIALLPHGRIPRAHERRDRHRPRDSQGDSRGARRHDRGRKRAREGHALHSEDTQEKLSVKGVVQSDET